MKCYLPAAAARLAALLALLAFAAPGPARAEMYEYQRSDGSTGYTDDPDELSPAERATAHEVSGKRLPKLQTLGRPENREPSLSERIAETVAPGIEKEWGTSFIQYVLFFGSVLLVTVIFIWVRWRRLRGDRDRLMGSLWMGK